MVVDLRQKLPHKKSMGGREGPAKSTTVGMKEFETQTERGNEEGTGMVHVHRTKRGTGRVTAQERGMEITTAAETDTGTENATEDRLTVSVTETETEKETETERESGTEETERGREETERGRETGTVTDIERETTAMTGSTGDETATATQMTEETLLNCWRGKNTGLRRNARGMAVESDQEEAGRQTRIAVATIEASQAHLLM